MVEIVRSTSLWIHVCVCEEVILCMLLVHELFSSARKLSFIDLLHEPAYASSVA